MSSEKYVVSLDAIDLSFLPTTVKRANGKMMPLWSKANFNLRNNEYYEFQINSKEQESDNESEIENGEEEKEIMDYTICRICDVDVPSPFINQHIDSSKHQIHLKIANTALERVKNSINIYTTKDFNKSSRHFCPVCVTVVEMNDKKSHQNSMSHKNAVTVEKFLEEFSKLYTKEDSNSECSDSDMPKVGPEGVGGSRELDKNIIQNQIINKPEIKVLQKEINDTFVTTSKHETSTTEKIGINNRNCQINPKIEELEKDLTRNFKELMIQFGTDSVTDNTNVTVDSSVVNIVKDEIKINHDSELSPTRHVHHHLVKSAFYIFCKICKKNISVDDLEHVTDLQHEISYENFIQDNSLYNKDSQHIECKVCKVTFANEEETTHCDEIRHITNCEKYKKRGSY